MHRRWLTGTNAAIAALATVLTAAGACGKGTDKNQDPERAAPRQSAPQEPAEPAVQSERYRITDYQATVGATGGADAGAADAAPGARPGGGR